MSRKTVCWLFLHGFFIGCRNQMRYAEIGAHANECRHKPSSDLDPLVSVMNVQFHCFWICFSSVMFVSVQIYTFWLLNSSTLVYVAYEIICMTAGSYTNKLVQKIFCILKQAGNNDWSHTWGMDRTCAVRQQI